MGGAKGAVEARVRDECRNGRARVVGVRLEVDGGTGGVEVV